jgi:sulfur relay (sulfurtransferase) DsrF/TusC family protein
MFSFYRKTIILSCLLFFFLNSYAFTTDTTWKLVCTEKEIKSKNKDVIDPVIIKTCLLNDFRVIDTAEPDYTGKYSHTYRLQKKINNRFVSVKNSSLFKASAITELESIINRQVKKEYEEYIADKELKSCFPIDYKLRYYKIDDLYISAQSIKQQKINFEADFEISCRNIGGSFTSFLLEALVPFFR